MYEVKQILKKYFLDAVALFKYGIEYETALNIKHI
jgi:hypothetical protein